MSGGQRLNHDDREASPFDSAAVLQLSHAPCQFAHGEDLDFFRECRQPRSKSCLQLLWQSGQATESMLATVGLSREAHSRKSQIPVVAIPSGGAAKVGGPFRGENVSKQMVVDDDGVTYDVARCGWSRARTSRRRSAAERASARSFFPPPGGRRTTASSRSITTRRPPFSRPHRWRTSAGTDICPLVETR